MCNCDLCVRGRVFREKVQALPEEHRPYFEELYDGLLDTEMDLEYAKCILDGSWPSAVEQLEAALKKAKDKHEQSI